MNEIIVSEKSQAKFDGNEAFNEEIKCKLKRICDEIEKEIKHRRELSLTRGIGLIDSSKRFCCKPYWISGKENEIIEEEAKKLLEKKIIRENMSK